MRIGALTPPIFREMRVSESLGRRVPVVYSTSRTLLLFPANRPTITIHSFWILTLFWPRLGLTLYVLGGSFDSCLGLCTAAFSRWIIYSLHRLLDLASHNHSDLNREVPGASSDELTLELSLSKQQL